MAVYPPAAADAISLSGLVNQLVQIYIEPTQTVSAVGYLVKHVWPLALAPLSSRHMFGQHFLYLVCHQWIRVFCHPGQ